MNNFWSCPFYCEQYLCCKRCSPHSTETKRKQSLHPKDNFGPAWPSKKVASLLFLKGRKWVVKIQGTIVCAWWGGRVGKGRKTTGDRTRSGLIFISKILKLNLQLKLSARTWVLADTQGRKHPPYRCLRVLGGFKFKTVTSAFNSPGKC